MESYDINKAFNGEISFKEILMFVEDIWKETLGI